MALPLCSFCAIGKNACRVKFLPGEFERQNSGLQNRKGVSLRQGSSPCPGALRRQQKSMRG